MIMITKMLTLTIKRTIVMITRVIIILIMVMIIMVIIKMKILQPLTFDINTLNLQKHFATVPSLKVDCKRIPPDQVSF